MGIYGHTGPGPRGGVTCEVDEINEGVHSLYRSKDVFETFEVPDLYW